MQELAALISSSTVHDRLRWDVETQFRQTRSNGWVWPGVGASDSQSMAQLCAHHMAHGR